MKTGESRIQCGFWTFKEDGVVKYRGKSVRISVSFDNKSSEFELKFSSTIDE